MVDQNTLFLGAWLATGTIGLVGGVVGVAVARRRIRHEQIAVEYVGGDGRTRVSRG